MRLLTVKIIILTWLLTSCANIPVTTSAPSTATQPVLPTSTQTLPPPPFLTSTQRPIPTPTIDALPMETGLDPALWMTWPVTPVVTQHVREIYQLGRTLGNDPHGFSILGDCQS